MSIEVIITPKMGRKKIVDRLWKKFTHYKYAHASSDESCFLVEAFYMRVQINSENTTRYKEMEGKKCNKGREKWLKYLYSFSFLPLPFVGRECL